MDFNEFCKYIRLLDDDTSIGIHGINIDLIKNQYEEYLSNKKTK